MNPNVDPLGLQQFRSQQLAKYPKMSTANRKKLDDYIERKQNEYATQALAATGNVDADNFSKLVSGNPMLAVKLIAGGYTPTSQPTAKQQETAGKKSDVLREVDLLESYLKNAEGRGPIAGRAAVFPAGVTKGAVNPNVYKFQEKRSTLIANLARLISGEVGVLTDQDIQRAESLLPRIEEPEEIANEKLRALRASLGDENVKGLSDEGSTTTSKKGLVQSLVESILYPLTETGKTIGGAAYETGRLLNPTTRANPTQRGVNENPFLSDQELGKYATDPGGQFLNQLGRSAALSAPAVAGATAAPGFLGALKGGAIVGGALGAATPREGVAPVERISDVAGGAVSGAAFGGATYGVLKLAANAGKIIHPFRSVGEVRQAAIAEAQGATVNWDRVVDQLQANTNRISPTDRTAYLRFVDQAKSMAQGDIPISQAVDIASRSNVAYTQAGKVGKSASAAFNDVLGKALKDQISQVAPKVGEANKLFSMLYKGQRAVKGTKQAAMTAGTFKLLGLLGL